VLCILLQEERAEANDAVWKSSNLGNYLEHRYDGMKQDLKTKQAEYINKNNELGQESYFCHPQTKLDVNKIYNYH
jgi:hypothetical protein